MNRITQCLHGRGTVSSVMHHRNDPQEQVPSRYLAFTKRRRPVVFWNLTDRCNLACAHCYSRSGPGRDTKNELSTAEALALIDDFSAMGVPLILFSGGEPLLRDDIWELARHAHAKGIKMALSTNGTLITADIAGKIKESGIEYAGISLDGATAATHDRFRNVPGAFERSVAAFARCREAGVRCGVRITLTQENCGELGDLVDLAQKIGASRFCLYWLVPTGRGMDAYNRLTRARCRHRCTSPALPQSAGDRRGDHGIFNCGRPAGRNPPPVLHGAGPFPGPPRRTRSHRFFKRRVQRR